MLPWQSRRSCPKSLDHAFVKQFVSGNSMQACFTASKCPARLPLSTVEMYCGSSGSRVLVSYQLKK